MVIAGTLVTVTAEEQAFADELYDRLPDSLTYIAQNWNEELLKPHGFKRSDQSRVSDAIKLLVAQGRVIRGTVYPMSGYAARRRDMCERPRKVVITKVP